MGAVAPVPRAGKSTDKVYEQIRLMAMTYEFLPGQRINEVELAKRLGVSRTPVREALNRLAADGFLSKRANLGFVGRLLDASEIFDLYEFRCALEEAIIRLACERATEPELDDLETFVQDLQRIGAEAISLERLRHDELFHLRIAALTHNAEFLRALEAVNSRIHFVRWIDLQRRGPSPDGHARLLRLLRERDPERCAAAIRSTIRRRYEEIVEVIRDGVAELYAKRTEPT